MNANELVLRVIDALEAHQIEYMLVGSYSSNVHGIPRSTEDADFVVDLKDDSSVSRLAARLAPELRLDNQLLFETVTGNLRYIISHESSPFKVELFLLSDDPHHQERFRRKVRKPLDSRVVWYQAAEDVIIQKLKWYARIKRSKDIEDVRDVVSTSFAELDVAYIRDWTTRHGTGEWFERLFEEAVRADHLSKQQP